ncbi:MAG: hypothetical protein P4M11_14665 [Candidatus Pacebacteria bacterium]|nr:hypothetical protein [Candidatus Paceibacterota bacterium]
MKQVWRLSGISCQLTLLALFYRGYHAVARVAVSAYGFIYITFMVFDPQEFLTGIITIIRTFCSL